MDHKTPNEEKEHQILGLPERRETPRAGCIPFSATRTQQKDEHPAYFKQVRTSVEK